MKDLFLAWYEKAYTSIRDLLCFYVSVLCLLCLDNQNSYKSSYYK